MIKFIIVSITMLLTMTAYSQSNCASSCSSECMRLAEQVIRNCGGNNQPAPRPPPVSQRTTLYNSDSCSNDVIAFLSPTTNCSSLTSSKRTWGVSIQGQCHDISDMSSDNACLLFKAASNFNSTFLYNNDRCEDRDLIAVVDENTACSSLSAVTSKRVWGVKIDGQCFDISDRNFTEACEALKNGNIPNQLSR